MRLWLLVFLTAIVLVSTAELAFAQESVVIAYLDAAVKAQSKEDKAKFYGMALKEAEEQTSPKLITRVHCEFGNFEEKRGNYVESEQLLLKAREVAPDPLMKAHANALLGNMYRFSGRPKQALPYCKESVALREANRPPTSFDISQALRTWRLPSRHGNVEEAAALYTRAIRIVENQPESKYHLAFAMSSLAQTRLRQGNSTAAQALADQAISIFQGLATTHSHNLGICYTTLAQLKEKSSNSSEALSLYLKAIEEFDKGEASTHIRALPALEGAAKLWREAGEQGKAEYFAKRASDIRSLRLVSSNSVLEPLSVRPMPLACSEVANKEMLTSS